MVRVDYVEDSLDDYGHLNKSNIRMTHFLVCDILDDLDIHYKNEKSFRGLNTMRYDIWLNKYNLLIEVDDPHHYDIHYLDFIDLSYNNRFISRVKNAAKRDKIKSDYCKDNDINLLRIPYWYTKADVISQLKEFINIDYCNNNKLPLIDQFIESDEYKIVIYDDIYYYDLNMIYDSYKKYLQNNDINNDVNKIDFKQYMINKLHLEYFMKTNNGMLFYHCGLKRKYKCIKLSCLLDDIYPVKKNINIKAFNFDLPSEELYNQLSNILYDNNSFNRIYDDIKYYDKDIVEHFKLNNKNG